MLVPLSYPALRVYTHNSKFLVYLPCTCSREKEGSGSEVSSPFNSKSRKPIPTSSLGDETTRIGMKNLQSNLKSFRR